ncbi:MAG: hypothetical protein GY834_02280 [Bacteroidetes bacterium]|nr:hypothetical protein [Bacteroidota bacterium]
MSEEEIKEAVEEVKRVKTNAEKLHDVNEIKRDFKKNRAERRKRIRDSDPDRAYWVGRWKEWQARGKQAQWDRKQAKKMQAQDRPNRKLDEWF